MKGDAQVPAFRRGRRSRCRTEGTRERGCAGASGRRRRCRSAQGSRSSRLGAPPAPRPGAWEARKSFGSGKKDKLEMYEYSVAARFEGVQ